MLNKLFKKRVRGSARASINYLLNKEEDKVIILKGDPNLSLLIAESCGFKNSYTVGCLSFEEEDINEESKYAIIERFEKCMFAGMEEEQYNITWIEHRDKGRLELNYFVPNVDLRSGKNFTFYLHKKDMELKDSFCEVINYEYGLSSPYDPEKKRAYHNGDLNEIKEKKELINTINGVVDKMAKEGVLNSREDIVKFLESNGLEVVRKSNSFISIKDPNGRKNIRLRGAYYEQDFSNSEEYRRELERRAREYKNRDEERYREAIERLQRECAKRYRYNKERYGGIAIKYTERDKDYRRESIEEDKRSELDKYNMWDTHRDIVIDNNSINRDNYVLRGEARRFSIRDEEIRREYGFNKQEQETREGRDSKGQEGGIIFSNTEEKRGSLSSKKWKISYEDILTKGKKYEELFRNKTRELLRRVRELFERMSGYSREVKPREQGIIEVKQGYGRREREADEIIEGGRGTKEGIRGFSREVKQRECYISIANREVDKDLDWSMDL